MQKQWSFLTKRFKSGNGAHAYLFSGKDIEHIKATAQDFAKFVNCGDEAKFSLGKFCNKCPSCQMIEKGIFSDLSVVKSQNSESSQKNGKDMMEIAVEQARQAQEFLAYTSYYGGPKLLIVENAERMSTEAQNCFLKTLEEPRGNAIIMLLSSKPDLLLPTILSRCQEIKFFGQKSQEVSREEENILKGLKKVLSEDLAAKFQYAKTANVEGENFNKILVALQKHLRHTLLENINTGNPVVKLQKTLTLVEDISHQEETGTINKKMALEIILMQA